MRAPILLAWVADLWRYPVKSMQGERVDALELSDAAVVGDRQYAVVDETGKALAAKTVPDLLFARARSVGDAVCVDLPDGTTVVAGDRDGDAALSSWLGRPVRLVRAAPDDECRYDVHVDATVLDSPTVEVPGPVGSFRDSRHPVHLLTTASLKAAAERHPDGVWDARRFRPNLVVDTDGEGFVEDGWVGSEIEVGAVRLEVRKPTLRCTVPARPQPGLDVDVDITRTLARHHDLNLGVYLGVLRPGRVSVGDRIRLA